MRPCNLILTNLPHFWQTTLHVTDEERIEGVLDYTSPDPVVETVLGHPICSIVALTEGLRWPM